MYCSFVPRLRVSWRWGWLSTACSALHLASHCTSDWFKVHGSLALSADQYLFSPQGAFEWVRWREGDVAIKAGRRCEEQKKNRQKWGAETQQLKREDYPRVCIFLLTIHTVALCPTVVCTCALPKTSNPLFLKWQSRSGPGYWFSGLIIKDYSSEVWLACDGFALILTEGRGMTWWFEPWLKHFSASELLQCEDSSAWLMFMYYSRRWLCFPFML